MCNAAVALSHDNESERFKAIICFVLFSLYFRGYFVRFDSPSFTFNAQPKNIQQASDNKKKQQK